MSSLEGISRLVSEGNIISQFIWVPDGFFLLRNCHWKKDINVFMLIILNYWNWNYWTSHNPHKCYKKAYVHKAPSVTLSNVISICLTFEWNTCFLVFYQWGSRSLGQQRQTLFLALRCLGLSVPLRLTTVPLPWPSSSLQEAKVSLINPQLGKYWIFKTKSNFFLIFALMGNMKYSSVSFKMCHTLHIASLFS